MRFPCFADDFQGLAAVTLAAALGAVPETGVDLKDHRILILGNGPHRVAIAEMLASAIGSEGKMMGSQARQNIFLADDDGLVTATSEHVNREHEETREVLLYSKDLSDSADVDEVRLRSAPARPPQRPTWTVRAPLHTWCRSLLRCAVFVRRARAGRVPDVAWWGMGSGVRTDCRGRNAR